LTLLDSNTLIHCLKGHEPAVARFRATSSRELAIPAIVIYELEYGTLRSVNQRRRSILEQMLNGIREVPFDNPAAYAAARIRIELEQKGVMIGPLDILIAGTALSRSATLATSNIREFSRIKGLRLEDWSV